MTVQEATYQLLNQLRKIYPDSEAAEITDRVMESLTGSAKAERMLYKHSALSPGEETRLQDYTRRLMQHEPVQYLLQEAWFFGMKFFVDRSVLIPRPETEELADWILADQKTNPVPSSAERLRILDMGTGSGCIAVSLKKKLPAAIVWACDLSAEALEIARKNAGDLGAEIHFCQLDFLDPESQGQLPLFDIIVSNPPYIPETDKMAMQPNVRDYEPGMALFVPGNDPLLFYRALADFGLTHLTRSGSMYVEIQENLADPTRELFRTAGYGAELKKDMQQKDRMLRLRF